MIGLAADEQQAVRAAALAWRGTPFHPQQAVPGVGVDCVRLIVASYRTAGLLADLEVDFPWGFWQHAEDQRFMAALMARFAVVWAREADTPTRPPGADALEIGDGLSFRRRPWPGTGHTAMYVGDGQIIHAIEGHAVDLWPLALDVLQHTLDRVWRLRRA